MPGRHLVRAFVISAALLLGALLTTSPALAVPDPCPTIAAVKSDGSADMAKFDASVLLKAQAQLKEIEQARQTWVAP